MMAIQKWDMTGFPKFLTQNTQFYQYFKNLRFSISILHCQHLTFMLRKIKLALLKDIITCIMVQETHIIIIIFMVFGDFVKIWA